MSSYEFIETEGAPIKAWTRGVPVEDLAWEQLRNVARLPFIHGHVAAMGGSFSAEHGIGRLKRDELVHYKSPVEVALMRRLKATLDPNGIMNPGTVV